MDQLTEYSKSEIKDIFKKYDKVDWSMFTEDQIAKIYFKTCKNCSGDINGEFEYYFLEQAQNISNNAFKASDVF